MYGDYNMKKILKPEVAIDIDEDEIHCGSNCKHLKEDDMYGDVCKLFDTYVSYGRIYYRRCKKCISEETT